MTKLLAAVTVLAVSTASAATIYVDDDICAPAYPAGDHPISVAIGDLEA